MHSQVLPGNQSSNTGNCCSTNALTYWTGIHETTAIFAQICFLMALEYNPTNLKRTRLCVYQLFSAVGTLVCEYPSASSTSPSFLSRPLSKDNLAREGTTDESRLKMDLLNSGFVASSPAREYRGGRSDVGFTTQLLICQHQRKSSQFLSFLHFKVSGSRLVCALKKHTSRADCSLLRFVPLKLGECRYKVVSV